MKNKARKNGMDQYDLEAEGEGNARRYFKENELGPKILNRRIAKESRKTAGAQKTVDCKATKNLVKDHAGVYKSLIIGRE